MPIHDWTRVDAGLFHHFHQHWIAAVSDRLNSGLLPPDCFALLEQRSRSLRPEESVTDDEIYARKADRLTVRKSLRDIVAVVEIISPGTKKVQVLFDKFLRKSASLLAEGVNLLIVDVFPPSICDPQGVHNAVWENLANENVKMPADKPLTLASYEARSMERAAYVDFLKVGDALPHMPLFLEQEAYVPVPLHASYQTAWQGFPAALRELLE